MPLYLKFYFWLLLISVVVFACERLFPWRRDQEVLRPGFVQDLFWMVFNMQYVSWMLAVATVYTVSWFNTAVLQLGLPSPDSFRLISDWPWWAQLGVVFVLKDFIEWNIHRAMHVMPLLWRVHQLHHSIEQLDWAATFRSHWGEIVVHKIAVFLPLVMLGAADSVIFAVVALSLVIQEVSHANVRWDWGPLRYIFNSPRFHAWHHDIEMYGRGGQNFGVNLVLWDWLFGTAHWPRQVEAPQRYGFHGMERYPSGIWGRLWAPFMRHPSGPEVAADASPLPRPLAQKEAAWAETQTAEEQRTPKR